MCFHEGTIIFFYRLENVITFEKIERHNTKGDVLKSYNQDVPTQKKSNTHSFFSPLKVEKNVPTTRKYQKLLTNVKCGMRQGITCKELRSSS